MKALWFLFSLRGRISRLPFCLHTAVVLAGGIVLTSQAAVLYRYTNEAGQTEIGTQIPPEAAARGYQIIDANGHVIRTVGPGDHVANTPLPEPVPERAPRERLFEDIPPEPEPAAEPEVGESAVRLESSDTLLAQPPPAPNEPAGAPIDPRIVYFTLFTLAAATAGIAAWSVLACHVKRWHDRDKRGWWTLLYLLPVIGWLWSVIELAFMPGTEGPNRYGERPNVPPDLATDPEPAWP